MQTPDIPAPFRRSPPGAEAGVTEDMIRSLVHAFYARVRMDPELGPIFEHALAGAWDEHLAKLCDFWSSVTLGTGRFQGRPMQVHAALGGIGSAHFERWLELFAETACETCPPAAATLFVARARMIAESLQLGLAFGRGELPHATGSPGKPPGQGVS